MPNARPVAQPRPQRGHHRPEVVTPRGDNQYFEELTRAVFQAGMDWGVIRNRWPKFQKAFKRFDPAKVAYFSPDDVDYLLSSDSGVIRNFRKVTATVQNAVTMLAIGEEFGSFKSYLRTFDREPYAVKVKDMKSRFRHLGDTGAFVFLYTVGEKVPSWADRKTAARAKPTKPNSPRPRNSKK